ncbi:MAG: 16S rRNA (guanine(527)-N(7))-methyltransferase RsmG [Chitinophagaceae bacterium]
MEKAPQDVELILKYFQDLSPLQQQQLAALDVLYKDWNNKINVISRKDIDGLYEKHVLHSLSIAAFIEFSAGSRIIDIGTGGGFPGIPLAIVYPDVFFHLTDSIGKKLKVVDHIVSSVALANVTTQHSRVEDIMGRRFDYAVSRAVAPLKDLWKWSRPLLAAKGVWQKTPDTASLGKKELPPGLICLKGGDLTQEIADLGGSVKEPVIKGIHSLFAEAYFLEKSIIYLPA